MSCGSEGPGVGPGVLLGHSVKLIAPQLVKPYVKRGKNDVADGDRPEIRGIMTIGIGPVRYVAGWGFTDGMDAAFGWDGD